MTGHPSPDAARAHPHRRTRRWLRHVVVVVLLAAMVGLIVITKPAFALSSLSPTEVLTDTEVGFVVSVAGDTVDLTSAVEASLPEGFAYLSCDAPEGWSCGGDASSVQWQRGASLDPTDARFVMTLRTPDTAGDRIFTLTDRRASGVSDTSTAIVSVSPPEPVVEEPSEEPSETETEEPEPEQTQAVVDDRPAPAVEPFRPPDGDAPISIRDLPDVEETEPAATASGSTGGGTSSTALIVAPIALLFLLSLAGFLTAQLNR